MDTLQLLAMLFPIVFMIHEFEEIIMFRHWLLQNRTKLQRNFPKVEAFLFRHGFFHYSTATFAVGIAHEFFWVSFVSLFSVCQEAYQWWFAALMGYAVHLLVHIVQWCVYRKYIPVVTTSLLTLPYCLVAFMVYIEFSASSLLQILLWTFVGIVLVLTSFPLTLFFMSRFHRWQNKR